MNHPLLPAPKERRPWPISDERSDFSSSDRPEASPSDASDSQYLDKILSPRLWEHCQPPSRSTSPHAPEKPRLPPLLEEGTSVDSHGDTHAGRMPGIRELFGISPTATTKEVKLNALKDLDMRTDANRQCSPKNELELVSNSTRANAVCQLLGDDAPPKSESMCSGPTTCEVSGDHKVVCGTDTKYPVAATETCGEVQKLDRFDDPLPSVLPNSTTSPAANPTSNLQTQFARSPNWESGDAPMDQGIRDENNEIGAFVATGHGVNVTPVTAWACHPTADRRPEPSVPPAPTRTHTNSEPDERQMNTQSPSPLFESHCPFQHLPPVLKCSCILVATMICLAVLRTPELSITRPCAAHSRQRMFRIIWVLAFLHFNSSGRESGGSSFPFEYGRASGSSQTSGGINSRLGDRSGIWSGLDLGPGLSELEGLGEHWDWEDILAFLHQGPDILSSKLTHDPINSSVPQQPNFSPRPPVPFDPYSAGYSSGYSAGHYEGHSAGYSEGIAHAFATLAQRVSIQGSGALVNSNFAPLPVTDTLKASLLFGLDGRAQPEGTMPVDPVSLLEFQPTNFNPSNGPPHTFTTQMAPNTEHQIPRLHPDPNSGPDPSGLRVTLNREAQPHDYFDYSLILNNNSSTDNFDISSRPVIQTQPSQWKPQHNPESPAFSGPSPVREATKTPKHWCDRCGRPFRRPHLLVDHKRVHTGEETSIYPCKFMGCARVYKSHSNMNRHFKSHLRGGNSQSPLSVGEEQMLENISERSPIAGPSTHNVRSRTSGHHSDRGTSILSAGRFHPYETLRYSPLQGYM